jgi:hypothetical protein
MPSDRPFQVSHHAGPVSINPGLWNDTAPEDAITQAETACTHKFLDVHAPQAMELAKAEYARCRTQDAFQQCGAAATGT